MIPKWFLVQWQRQEGRLFQLLRSIGRGMSEPDALAAEEDGDAGPEAGNGLQFDQAEYETPAPAGPSCALCKQPINDEYHELNGKILCVTCRQRVEGAFRGGSTLARAVKAVF